MKILLTNNHLERLGGSETWVYTMAQELKRRGYQVGVYTKVKGYVSDLLKDLRGKSLLCKPQYKRTKQRFF